MRRRAPPSICWSANLRREFWDEVDADFVNKMRKGDKIEPCSDSANRTMLCASTVTEFRAIVSAQSWKIVAPRRAVTLSSMFLP
jgi:hypothetical protein